MGRQPAAGKRWLLTDAAAGHWRTRSRRPIISSSPAKFGRLRHRRSTRRTVPTGHSITLSEKRKLSPNVNSPPSTSLFYCKLTIRRMPASRCLGRHRIAPRPALASSSATRQGGAELHELNSGYPQWRSRLISPSSAICLARSASTDAPVSRQRRSHLFVFRIIRRPDYAAVAI